MARNVGAKVAIGTAIAGGAGLGIFLLTRKARAAEEEAEAFEERAKFFQQQAGVQRGQAVAASGRAAAASAAAQGAAERAAYYEQMAHEAARREQYAQQLVAWSRAHAQQAGQAAQAAIDAAKLAAGRAAEAARQARLAAQEAIAERQVDRKAALQREADMKGRHARELAAVADRAAKKAQEAEALARQREQAEREAESKRVEEQKGREQIVHQARAQKEAAVKEGGPDLVNMECARQAVASGFQEMKNAIMMANPGYSEKRAINEAAKRMRAQGVVLDKPDPSLPFWTQPCEAVRSTIQAVVSDYVAVTQGRKFTQQGKVAEPGQPPPPKTSTVTTQPPEQSRQLAEATWVCGIEYYMQAAIRAAQPATSTEAKNAISNAFRRASQFGPGMPAVPDVNNLKSADPYWAQSLDTIKQGLVSAYRAVVGLANTKYMLTLATPAASRDGQTSIWVYPDQVQRDPNGNVIRRQVMVGGKRIALPVAKSGTNAVDPQQELVRTMCNKNQEGLAGFAGAPQHVGPFCTVA